MKDSERRQWENPDGDKHKLGRGKGSEKGVVGKGSMREKKSQLDKQTNIKQKKRKARKITDLQYTQREREAHPSKEAVWYFHQRWRGARCEIIFSLTCYNKQTNGSKKVEQQQTQTEKRKHS